MARRSYSRSFGIGAALLTPLTGVALAALIALTLAVARPALAQTETVLHSFNGKDGSLAGQRLTLTVPAIFMDPR